MDTNSHMKLKKIIVIPSNKSIQYQEVLNFYDDLYFPMGEFGKASQQFSLSQLLILKLLIKIFKN